MPNRLLTHGAHEASSPDVSFRDVLEAVPLATVVLDRAGLVVTANRAFVELLELPAEAVIGEPFLMWLSRSTEREGFGRAFRSLAEREPSRGFVLDVGLAPRVGPPRRCVVRATKLEGGQVTVTCSATAQALDPEAELGLAVTRSLEALDQGVLLVSGDTRIVRANPAATQLLGPGLEGQTLLELTDHRAAEELSRALAVARGGSWQGELTLRRRDGESLPVEATLASGKGPAVVFLRDLRQARRREFEARLMAQVDRCLVAGDDPQKSVMAAGAALAEAVGARHLSVLVRTSGEWQRWSLAGEEHHAIEALPSDVQPPAEWVGLREAALVDPTQADIKAAFGSLEGVRSAARLVLRAPSGVVGHLLLGHHEPEPWDARDRSLMAAVAAQIALGLASGLLNLETREMATFQAMVLDQTSVLIDSVDARGRVVTWNRASEHLLGIAAPNAVGRRFGLDVAKASSPAQWSDLWQTLLREGSVTRELTVLRESAAFGMPSARPQSNEVPLHLEGRLLREGDDVQGAVFVGLDLRDRKTLETQILQSQKLAAVGLLAAGIAHEINNPLSGVVGYSKLLLERELDEGVRHKVEKIAQSGERCRKIVEGVLLFARQKEGGVRRRVDLCEVVQRVIAIGEYQWRVHNVRIVWEREASVPVMADGSQLEQVVLNLLSNAVDAMPRGGTVRLSVFPGDRGMATLIVQDEGTGIPPEILGRIFDPFFSTKEIGKGTGLGLAISYGIVQDHGGDILIESQPGHGARFTVLLPAADEVGHNQGPSRASRR